MRSIISLALPLWGISASHVYDHAPLESRIHELVETKTVGWAVPVELPSMLSGPEVWFATEMGSDKVRIGPWSTLARKSSIQLSLADNDQMSMKLLARNTEVNGISQLSVANTASFWGSNARLSFENRVVGRVQVVFDFYKRDIELNLPLRFFADVWSMGAIREYKSRLLVPCSELERRRNSGGLNFKIGDVSIAIREVINVDAEISELRQEGWCPLNVMLNAPSLTIGRTILEQYDLLLDASNLRMVVLAKSNTRPARPLMKYRLDRDYPRDPTSGAWRWIPSTDRANQGEFVFLKFDKDSARFGIFCLVKSCEEHIIPSKGALWVGVPVVELDPTSGTITVQEIPETRGWQGYEIRLQEKMQTVDVSISRSGYRMKPDPAKTVKGLSMELVPVEGAKQVGEFSIPEWPPVFRRPIIDIAKIYPDDADAVIAENEVWHGVPKFEIISENRILITAQVTDDTCDREISFFGSFPGAMYLDFSTEICNYRQVGADEEGYRFTRMRRSEPGYSDALRIIVQQGHVSFHSDGEQRLFSMNQPKNVWSPTMRWLAAPELTTDPESGEISISPTGEAGWEYTHEWERENESGTSKLVFRVLPRTFLVPPGLLLTDGLWEFTAAAANPEGSRFSIVQDRWRVGGQRGGITLVFDEIEGTVFQGASRGFYAGIPEISFNEAGSLIVRSNGDQRQLFELEARESGPRRIKIVFTPSDFAPSESVSVEAKPEDDKYPICFDEYTPGEMIAETWCKHRFHLSCLQRVVGRKCPLCRASLDRNTSA